MVIWRQELKGRSPKGLASRRRRREVGMGLSPLPTSIRSSERVLYLVGQGRQRTEIYVSHRQINRLTSRPLPPALPEGRGQILIDLPEYEAQEFVF